MDTPAIRYVRTEDGVNIAYEAHGDGAPVVFMPVIPAGQLAGGLQHPATAASASSHMAVTYDARGHGLSDRAPAPPDDHLGRRDSPALEEHQAPSSRIAFSKPGRAPSTTRSGTA